MPYTVTKLEVWTGPIVDAVGGLAAKLEPLAMAGANLQFVIARRQPREPGKGVVFLAGVSGGKAAKAAAAAGLAKTNDLVALRVEGPNKAGAGYQITCRLAEAGINLRGLSAGVMGNKFLLFLALDSAADAAKAARLLRATGGKRK
jgi:hypothetical protein